jgi:hypothetical protein
MMSDYASSQNGAETNSRPNTPPTVRVKDIEGVVTVTGATETVGLYGPQLRLILADGRKTYIPATSGLAKGLAGGKLKVPLQVSAQKGYGPKGPYTFLGLAPRTKQAHPTTTE